MDTALFVVSGGETKDDSTLVCFTESKDKDVCLHYERCKCASQYQFSLFSNDKRTDKIFLCLYRGIFGKEN